MSTTTELERVEVQEQPTVREPKLVPRSVAPAPPSRPLFSDSFLQVEGLQRRRRSAATMISFVLQCVFVGLLILVPLMITDTLPAPQLLTYLVAPPPPPPPPPAPAATPVPVRVIRQSDIQTNGQLRTPSRIPQKVEMIREEQAPPPVIAGGVVGGVPGGIPGGQLGGVIGGIISSTANTKIVPTLAPPQRVRVSQGVTSGLLIRKVEPEYPAIARQARIQGQVVLEAIIAKEGTVQNLRVVSGHPLLVNAALSAVRQWRYRPYLLNGVPVEVETTVVVTFRFAQ
jgi:periplasmic protein TonB